jgi:hypothetical protein
MVRLDGAGRALSPTNRSQAVIARFLVAGKPAKKDIDELKGLELLQRSAELIQLAEECASDAAGNCSARGIAAREAKPAQAERHTA